MTRADFAIVWRDKHSGKMRKTMRRTRRQAAIVARERRAAGHTDVKIT
jgi:hypothetical protein